MNRKTSFRILGLALTMLPLMAGAQVHGLTGYRFSTGIDASRWVTVTNTTNICPEGDYAASAVLPIGFVFPFGDATYTQFSVNSDGILRLGPSVTGTNNYSEPLSSGNAGVNNPKIAGWGRDGFMYTSTGHVYYQTFGDSLLVVDFILSPYADESVRAKFQIQLFSDGRVQIVYNTPNGSPDYGQVGMCIDASDGWAVSDDGSSATHFTNGSNAELEDFPSNGRYYLWQTRYNCKQPTGLAASGITSSGYTISWDAVAGATKYTLFNNLAERSVTTTSYTYSELAGCEGDYTAAVQAICGNNLGDTSLPAITTVNLGGVTSFHENFDSYTGSGVSTDCTWSMSSGYAARTLPAGWWFPGAYTGNSPSDGTANIWLSQATCSGPGLYPGSATHMEFKHATPSLKTYAAMPLLSQAAASVSMDFKYMIEDDCVTMYLGIMTDLSSESAAIASYQRLMTLNAIGTWTTVHADFATLLGGDYPPNSYRIVFEYANSCSGLGYRGYIDEIEIGTEFCSAPTNVEFTNVTPTSLRVGWTSTAPSTATYTIYLDGVEYATTAAGATYHDITGLTPLSRHTVGVRTNCVVCEQYSQTVSMSLRTMCDGTVTLPYSENFDAYTYATSATMATPNAYPNHTLPACWTFTGLSANKTTYPQAFITKANAHERNCLVFVNSASSNTSYAALPLVAGVDVEHLRLDFYYRESATSTAVGELTIGTMADPNDASTFVALRTLPKVTSWTRIQDTVGLHDPAASARYLAFRYSGGTSSAQWAAIDSVRVTALNCLPVSGLTFTATSTTSVRITWNDHNHGTTTYTVSCNGQNYTTAPGATEYSLTGRNKGESFMFTVVTNCSGSLQSDPRSVFGHTACDDGVTLPYLETFDWCGDGVSTNTNPPAGYGSNTDPKPACWTFLNRSTSTSTYPQVFLTNNATYRVSGNGMVMRSSSPNPLYAIVPLPDGNVPTSRLHLEFQYKQSVANDNIGILIYGVMSDPANARSFVPLDTLEKRTAFSTVAVDLGALSRYQARFAANDRPHVAFKYVAGASNTTYTAIDNVSLREICFGGLRADSVTASSCILRWTDFSGGTNTYSIYLNGGLIGTTAAGAEQYPIMGLPAGTTYTFKVVANASGCEEKTINVTTPCAVAALPYNENFDSYPSNSGYYSTGTGVPTRYPNHTMPDCWTYLNMSSASGTPPQMFLTTSSTYRNTGKGFLFRASNSTNPIAVVAKDFGLTSDKTVVSFKYKVSNASNTRLEYGVMTNPSDENTFIALGHTSLTTWTTVQDTIANHNNLPQGTLYLAFRFVNVSTSTYFAAIDDVSIKQLPECGIYNLRPIIKSSTSVVLTWKNPYHVPYTTTIYQGGVSIGTTEPGDTSFTLTGLDMNTEYTITLMATCGTMATTHFIIEGYGCIDPTDLTAGYVKGYYGVYTNPYQTVGIVDNGPSSNTSRHTIHTDVNERDAKTNNQLRTVPQGHTKSVRLGNWSTGKQAEALNYTMIVDTLISDMLVLKYAAVLQAAGHPEEQQPRFRLEILDETLQAIDPICGVVDFIASTNLGWNQIGSGSNAVLWKDWTSIGIDLKPYHGQTVFIRLTTYDCAQSAHYGYAYFAMECTRRNIESTTCGETIGLTTFTAPDGFGYQWYLDTNAAPISYNRQILVPGTGNNIYYCRLNFVDIPGCSFMTSAYAGTRYPLALFDTVVTASNCQYDVRFINQSTITADGVNPIGTGEGVESAEWLFPGSRGTGTSNQYNPTAHYETPGNYEITLIAKLAGGTCTDTLRRTLHISGAVPPALVGPTAHCPSDVPDTIILKNSIASTWNSDTMIVTPQAPTTYTVTATDSNGCEYNLTHTITIHSVAPIDTTGVVCDSLRWRGTTYTTSGNYAYTRTNGSGCSETDSLHLTVNYSNIGDTTAIVTTDFPWHGTIYTASGDYTRTFTNASGCDSVVTLHLTINPNTVGYDTITVCDSLQWKGNLYTTSGNYQFDTLNVAGADSTLYLHLTINHSTSGIVRDTIVENQLPHVFNNEAYTHDTTHAFTHVTNTVGCDSLIDYNLFVYRNIYNTVDSTVCDNWLPLTWNGETFTGVGNATVTLTAQHGEDSILTMNVHVNPTYTVDAYDTVVENQLPYVWHGLNFNGVGDQTALLQSSLGCDSLVTMHLYVWQNLTGTDDSTVCDNLLPVLWNGVIFSDEGVKTATLTAQHGEDSVVTMTLHVNQTFATTEEHEICDNGSYTFNGTTYNRPNTYRHTLTSRNGCDSVATLRLIVHNTYRTVEDLDICANQQMDWGSPRRTVWTAVHANMPGASQTRTITESDNLQTVNHGCDSVSVLNLTIHGVYLTNEIDTFCFGDRYQWHGQDVILNSEANNVEKTTTLYDSIQTRRYRCDSIFCMKLTQRAHPVVSMTYETGCSYKVRISVDVPYHIITASPEDTSLNGNEHSTYFETRIAEPTEYMVYADYYETPTCPYTTTMRLDPIVPLQALLKVTPEVLTADNLEYNLIDAGESTHTRRWLINGEEQADTSWHLFRLADYSADSVEVELRVFLEGCSDTTSQIIYIRHNVLYAPNAFTPGRNDNNRFAIIGGDIVSGELKIYNREGLLVYQTDDYTTGWDGGNATQGVYVWQFTYTTIGRPNTTLFETGSVLLIR